MNTLGQRLKAAREKQRFTIQHLCFLTDIAEERLAAFEGDCYVPSLSELFALKKALNCSLDWLFCGDSPDSVVELLSSEEERLLSMVRLLDESDRQCVLELAALFCKKNQELHNVCAAGVEEP